MQFHIHRCSLHQRAHQKDTLLYRIFLLSLLIFFISICFFLFFDFLFHNFFLSLGIGLLYLLFEMFFMIFRIYPYLKKIENKENLFDFAHRVLCFWKKDSLKSILKMAANEKKENDIKKLYAKLRTRYEDPALEVFLVALSKINSYDRLIAVMNILFPEKKDEIKRYVSNLFSFYVMTLFFSFLHIFLLLNHSFFAPLCSSFVGSIYFGILFLLFIFGPMFIQYEEEKERKLKIEELLTYFRAYGQFLKPYEAFEKACEISKDYGFSFWKKRDLLLGENSEKFLSFFSTLSKEEQKSILYISHSIKETHLCKEVPVIEKKEKFSWFSLFPFLLNGAFFLFIIYGGFYL